MPGYNVLDEANGSTATATACPREAGPRLRDASSERRPTGRRYSYRYRPRPGRHEERTLAHADCDCVLGRSASVACMQRLRRNCYATARSGWRHWCYSSSSVHPRRRQRAQAHLRAFELAAVALEQRLPDIALRVGALLWAASHGEPCPAARPHAGISRCTCAHCMHMRPFHDSFGRCVCS
jgi:hypothetical protein